MCVGTFAAQVSALADKSRWQSAYAELDRAGPAALDDILAGLNHSYARVRKFCAALLDHNADAGSVPALVAALTDADAGVRRLAIHAIGCQRCKRAPLDIDVAALLIARLTQDLSLRVRQVAAQMLGNQARFSGSADPRIIAALQITLERERNPKLLANARWALAEHRAAQNAKRSPAPACEISGVSAR